MHVYKYNKYFRGLLTVTRTLVSVFQGAGRQEGGGSVPGRSGLGSHRRLHGVVQQAHAGPGGPRHAGGAELAQRPGEDGRVTSSLFFTRRQTALKHKKSLLKKSLNSATAKKKITFF